ncbi:DUF968 domain-containing protein [Leisingera sp. ANG-M7]|uniref:DUF968 domain-containing protein n=1 Tax=Leisingera sp. ANG-M7 TaxID=1577902 RepID=UPI00057CBDFE|nr:DUF968 domain-containing protein [Leisingera sp. ANG-M7]KIC39388.1 hypothetical protein RA26_01695 [Leisingera sp. ANG-M7]
MNIANRGPLGLKKPKAKKDSEYLRKVRAMPCCICESYGYTQISSTTAHHPICERHGGEKVPDHEAIPLCDGHHQGDFDTSKIAIHRDRALWVEWYGSDRDWIAPTQDRINAAP